jgi:hypothetical protein
MFSLRSGNWNRRPAKTLYNRHFSSSSFIQLYTYILIFSSEHFHRHKAFISVSVAFTLSSVTAQLFPCTLFKIPVSLTIYIDKVLSHDIYRLSMKRTILPPVGYMVQSLHHTKRCLCNAVSESTCQPPGCKSS